MTVEAETLAGKVEAPAAMSSLAAGEAVAERAQEEAGAFGRAVREALVEAVDRFQAADPDLSALFREADHLTGELQRAFQHRYGLDLQAAPYAAPSARAAAGLADWNRRAEEALSVMAKTRVPFRSKSRQEDQAWFRSQFSDLIRERIPAEHRTLQEAHAKFVADGSAAARQVLAARIPELQGQLRRMTPLPPVIGSLGDDALAADLSPGVGRLLLHVGFAETSQLTLVTFAPAAAVDQAAPSYTTIEFEPLRLPMLLDLDRDGGFVTDDAAVVNNTILRLLALVPAGQVKTAIFDPARLGESADFLFALGESAEAIIGGKIKTTERELAETLLELEEHITFVTQKYLQSSFDSLTEYNIAAGDVAEPYRLLVLYDYPRGFFHPGGGGLDGELLARLGKVIDVGRRCGVFTLVETEQTGGRGPEGLPSLCATDSLYRPELLALLVLGNPASHDLALNLPSGKGTSQRQLAAARSRRLFAGDAAALWHYRHEQPASARVVDKILTDVERGLVHAADVRVLPGQVAGLAAARLARDVDRGTRAPEVLPDPAAPATWWHGTAADQIEAPFGRAGARDVSVLRLDSRTASGVLLGGRPGSGKSILLHAIITSLALRYSPQELQLYLVDFKEGVEFKAYASGGLPHARVVAIESDREFGLSVLRALNDEIERRGARFREGVGEEVNLAAYRSRTGEELARIVLMIDEFHVLFERDDKLAAEAAELLDRVVRQGRAFGVHCILASQTIAGVAALGRHTLGLLPIRIAMQCSDADSRLLLADDNADARLLTRPGEGILNTASGARDANVRFQAVYSEPDERIELVARLRALADERGFHERPVVFEGNAPVRIDDLAPAVMAGLASPGKPRLPLGMPLTLGGPVVAELPREPGGNLLVVGDDEAGWAALATAVTALRAAGIETDVLDFGPLDAPWLETVATLGIQPARRHDAEARLKELAQLVDERLELHDHQAAARVCVVGALHRARELDPSSGDEASELLEQILRDGPDVGVHVIAWCDKPVSLGRRLSSSALREFSLRLVGQMSRDDSFSLIDSDLAATLAPSQAVLDDHDRATSTRLRRFTAPTPEWVQRVGLFAP